jgi:RNA polymerase sigma factor (sigma-70 family)
MTHPDRDDVQTKDLVIVRRCIEEPHGEEAWRAFLIRFGHIIENSIRQTARTASDEDREDVFQAILLRLISLNGLGGYTPQNGPFRPYLRTVAANAVRDLYRKAPPETAMDEPELSLAAEARRVADQFPPVEESELVALILRHLENKVSDIPKLRAMCDIVREVPIEEVRKRHGISQATAYRYRMECWHQVHQALGKPSPPKAPPKKV